MTSFDCSPLIKNDEDYRNLSESVSQHYIGAWDDPIHDSFREYVRLVNEQSNDVHRIRLTTEKLMEEIEKQNVEAMQKRANDLCVEADEV